MTFDTMWARIAKEAFSKSRSSRFQSGFWTELKIRDKHVPIIGDLHTVLATAKYSHHNTLIIDELNWLLKDIKVV